MDIAHTSNLAVHIGAGSIGILIGLAILVLRKGTRTHRRLGQVFAGAALIVSLSATLGLTAFRFMPLFAVLTVLTTYQLISGWRAARLKERGPQAADAALTALAVTATALLLPVLLSASAPGNARPIVVLSTLSALALILFYDSLRWLFPRRWYAWLWRYEHIYKLISSFAALTSAFAGNVLVAGQPWSQIAPSAVGTVLIIGFFVQNARRRIA
jgi:uncharacterized membrane protein